VPLQYDALKSWSFPAIEQQYTDRDTMLYALAIGLGSHPVDSARLRFVYETDLLALPTMAGLLGYPGFWLADSSLGLDWLRIVHGEQAMTLHRPLPPAASVVAVNRVAAVIDKGIGRGALVVTERTISDRADGSLLATLRHTAFCRGDGGFSATHGVSDSPLPSPPPLPHRPADFVVDLETRPDAALLYRLTGDRAPIHADPDLAKAAGFARPILHGLGIFGVVGHAILKATCAYDPSRLRALSARFASPVYPGETIRTAIWVDTASTGGLDLRFRASVVGREPVVLNYGSASVGS
jgi:acyl dehydratase